MAYNIILFLIFFASSFTHSNFCFINEFIALVFCIQIQSVLCINVVVTCGIICLSVNTFGQPFFLPSGAFSLFFVVQKMQWIISQKFGLIDSLSIPVVFFCY
jgi:hypothetical protein